MGRGRTTVAALAVGVALAGCQAPLEPESRRSAEVSPTASPSPTASASPTRTDAPSPSAGASGSAEPEERQRVPDPDEITIPEGLESAAARRGPVLGGDVSWPQCPEGMGIPQKRTLGLPMPVPEAAYVVIGLTNGPGFTPNPCVESQLAWVRERGLLVSAYSVLSYPYGDQLARYGDEGPYDGSTRLGALRNVGYQQAGYNVATMQRIGFRTPLVWLDVEPVPSFSWSDDPVANAAVVEGAARGYTDAGYRVGVYSTQYMWREIVADLTLGVPEWRAAGQTSREEALRRCGPEASIQGGSPVMSQWVMDSRDFNVTCPGASARLPEWFAQT